MAFIEIEKSVREQEWSMHELHSHTHYEIYFLSKGERAFFLSNALYKVSAPVVVVIPPHVMHKTEGAAFERYNVNVSADYLNPYQKDTLHAHALQILHPDRVQTEMLTNLFEKASKTDRSEKHATHVLHALFSYSVYLLDELKKSALPPIAATQKEIPPLVLKIIEYLHGHYAEQITLQSLAEHFFISKTSLIYIFKKHTSCSPIDFLLNVRLTKAKEMLVSTKKSVEEIAEACGFSSANYFGLIFKKKEGLSPMQYKKNQQAKR